MFACCLFSFRQNDPFLFDSCLSALGRQQVADLTERVKEMDLKPDLIISSPLCRALETALAFAHFNNVSSTTSSAYLKIPLIVHPWARERVDTACDIGTPSTLLKEKWSAIFPNADFSLLSDELWFFSPNPEVTADNYQELFKSQPWKEPFGNQD